MSTHEIKADAAEHQLVVTTYIAPAHQSATEALLHLKQQTDQGGGWFFADAHFDSRTLERIRAMASAAGREQDILVLNFNDVKSSLTYNPLVRGTTAERCARIMTLMPNSEDNPGAAFYKRQAMGGLTVVFDALAAAGRRTTFSELSELLQSVDALRALEAQVPQDSPTALALHSLTLPWLRNSELVPGQRDATRLKMILGSVSGRIAMMGQGTIGQIFNTITPDIDLVDVVQSNKLLYVVLPGAGGRTVGEVIDRLITSDLEAAVREVKAAPGHASAGQSFIRYDWSPRSA
jgi:intracellular multiplication protein IcmO